jgi:uncharacterized protein (DUF2384 family)
MVPASFPPLGDVAAPTLGSIAALHRGLPLEAVDAAVERKTLTCAEAERYIISQRTLARIVRVTARAAKTFGSQADASAWLREPNGALRGRVPPELLQSSEGALLIGHILGRIDHGIYT